MKTPLRKNGFARPAENDFLRAKQRLQEARWKAKLKGVTNAEIPDRDELDYFGDTFPGLSRLKLEQHGITEEEQATNSTDSRVLQSDASVDANRAVVRHAIRNKAVNVDKLDDNLNGINGKLPDNEITKAKISGGGRWVKDDLPSDTAFQNDIVKNANQLSWGRGSRYIPGGALRESYARAEKIDGINQSIKGLNNKVDALRQQIRNLQQSKKKN